MLNIIYADLYWNALEEDYHLNFFYTVDVLKLVFANSIKYDDEGFKL